MKKKKAVDFQNLGTEASPTGKFLSWCLLWFGKVVSSVVTLTAVMAVVLLVLTLTAASGAVYLVRAPGVGLSSCFRRFR